MQNKYCRDCDENYDVRKEIISCNVCGSSLSILVESQINTIVTDNTVNGINLDNLLSELIGNIDFQTLEESIRQQTTKKLSRQYLSSLGKVLVDKRMVINFDFYIQIGNVSQPVKIMATLADFSPFIIPNDNVVSGSNITLISDREIVLSDPICGEMTSTQLNNQQYLNKIIFMDRGNISFATKAKHAQLSGASCLLVAQTYDVWPFVMTDNSWEIDIDTNSNSMSETNTNLDSFSPESAIILNDTDGSRFKLNIPVVMISKSDADHLRKLISSVNNMKVSLHVGEKCVQCAICCDDFIIGCEVLKLPCRHMFHSTCIHSWLDGHNNCPLCRYDMLSDTNGEVRAPQQSSSTNSGAGVAFDSGSRNMQSQPYFI